MSYDESLAARVRLMLPPKSGFVEKKMFGGLGFLLHGNMCVGVWKEFLIVRVGPDAYDDALAKRFVNEFDITGRAMKGWVMVEPEGTDTDDELSEWVQKAITFVRGLPKK
jgi:hypothetical protein